MPLRRPWFPTVMGSNERLNAACVPASPPRSQGKPSVAAAGSGAGRLLARAHRLCPRGAGPLQRPTLPAGAGARQRRDLGQAIHRAGQSAGGRGDKLCSPGSLRRGGPNRRADRVATLARPDLLAAGSRARPRRRPRGGGGAFPACRGHPGRHDRRDRLDRTAHKFCVGHGARWKHRWRSCDCAGFNAGTLALGQAHDPRSAGRSGRGGRRARPRPLERGHDADDGL